MSLLCRRHHLPVSWRTLPSLALSPVTLPCTLTMATPSTMRWIFRLALPYPNWLTTHKQAAPSPSTPLPPPSTRVAACLHLRAQVAVIIVQFHWLAMTIASAGRLPPTATATAAPCSPFLLLLLLLLPGIWRYVLRRRLAVIITASRFNASRLRSFLLLSFFLRCR